MLKWARQLLGKTGQNLEEVELAKQALQVKLQASALDALQGACAWLICLNDESHLPALTRLQLMEWAQTQIAPIVQSLESQFLLSPSSNRVDTQAQWQTLLNYYQDMMLAHQTMIDEWQSTGQLAKLNTATIALVCARFFRMARNLLKWLWVRHSIMPADFWLRVSSVWVLVESTQVQLLFVSQPEHTVETNPLREWLSLLMLQVSAPDSLNAIQICALEHIVSKTASVLVVQTKAEENTPFYVPLSQALPPARLIQGAKHDFTLRYFGAVSALPLLQGLKRLVNNAQSMNVPVFPERVNLPSADYLAVIEHCNRQWQPQAVVIREDRRAVTQRLQIIHGLSDIVALVLRQKLVVSNDQSPPPDYFAQSHHSLTENWLVENVSMNGVGAKIPFSKRPWVEVGALVAVKTEQTPEWWIGVIRRLYSDQNNAFFVGIETLSYQPSVLSLKPIDAGHLGDESAVLDEHLTGYATVNVILLEKATNDRLSCICAADAMCLDGLYGHVQQPLLGVYRVVSIHSQNNLFWCVELQKEL